MLVLDPIMTRPRPISIIWSSIYFTVQVTHYALVWSQAGTVMMLIHNPKDGPSFENSRVLYLESFWIDDSMCIYIYFWIVWADYLHLLITLLTKCIIWYTVVMKGLKITITVFRCFHHPPIFEDCRCRRFILCMFYSPRALCAFVFAFIFLYEFCSDLNTQ